MFDAGFPVFPYVSFRRWHDPRSGLRTQVSPPRISQGYTAIQNRPGLLIETHMLKPYKQRVEATYKMIELSIDFLSREGKALQKLNIAADKKVESKAFREKPFVIDYRLSMEDSVMVGFMGIDYHVEKSDLTGGNWFRYHKGEERDFQLPLIKKEARKMLKENPELMEAFEIWKQENPDAAQNQWAQLNWFYQRSPWWDKKKDVYQVVRLMDATQLN